jgi:hypothetical protein
MSDRRLSRPRPTLRLLSLLAALLLAPGPVLAQSADAPPEATTQRFIVKFRAQPAAATESESERDRGRVSRLAADGGIALAYVRPMALGAHVVALDRPVPLSQARAIARRLAGHAEVEYVQPDRRMRAQFVPNDQYLNLQTYLRDDAAAIGAFSAWDLTTGSASTVVAVVDTGYRPHAAMAGRILPGYDFVSNPDVANDGDATQTAERILLTLSTPFKIEGHELTISASIGIALVHKAGSTGRLYLSPDEILRDADTAMYRAKTEGRSRHAVFRAGMHAHAVALLQTEADLRQAIERQEFELYYQPIVAVTTGKITCVEALVRWRHPQRGLVAPGEFITVAEESGLIVRMGAWYCAQPAARLRPGMHPVTRACASRSTFPRASSRTQIWRFLCAKH